MNNNTNEQLNTDFEQDGLQFEELDYDEDLRWSEEADEMPQYHSNARSYFDSDAEREAQIAVAEAKEEEDEERRKRVIGFFKIMSLMVVAFVVLIFAVIAWFAMNKNVTSNGMAVMAADTPFEIATKGTADTTDVRHKSILESVETIYEVGTQKIIEGNSYYTSEGVDGLMLRFTPGTDDPATENVDESLPPDVGPNSSGQLNLYVIPKKNGDLTIRFNMDVVGYAYVNAYRLDANEQKIQATDENDNPLTDANDNPVYETERKLMRVSDITTDSCNISQASIDDIVAAEDYLRGHIMFFGGESPSPSTYSYMNPYTDRTLLFDESNLSANVAYPVPIYWMWANTFGQIALKDNTSGLRGNGIPIVQDSNAASGTDKAAVIQYLKDNKTNIFYNLEKIASLPEGSTDGKTQDEIDELIGDAIDTKIDQADVADNYRALSKGYNSADSMIGTELAYFMIEVTVELDE